MYAAAHEGVAAMVALLLQNGGHVDEPCCRSGSTPLAVAAVEGRDSVVEVLLNAGADPNWCDSDGTPLLVAVQELEQAELMAVDLEGPFHGRANIARLLVAGGADPDRTNKRGATSLHIAAYNDDAELVCLLLRHGANKDAIDADGFTPLMRAIGPCYPHFDFTSTHPIRPLLEAGSLVTVQSPADKGGETALHLAVGWDKWIVEALLAAGASRTLRNSQGLTPLEVAETERYMEVAALLRREDS